MSVRLSTILLAVLLVLSVAMVLFQEWQGRNAAVVESRQQLALLSDARILSHTVHLLQKERGLTAGQLAGDNVGIAAMLKKQREGIDQHFARMQQAEISIARSNQLAALRKELPIFRAKVDAREVDWPQVRAFYTRWITSLLDETALLRIDSLSHEVSNTVRAVHDLAVSREKLGLIRAGVNRIYSRQAVDSADLIAVASNFGALNEHLHAFRRDINPQNAHLFAERVENETYKQVIAQIEHLLKPGGGRVEQTSTVLWWGQASLAIDAMKGLETELLDQLQAELEQDIAKQWRLLRMFIMLAVGLLVAAIGLTVHTVVRVLRALSVLIQSLNRIMQTENFGVRLPLTKSDEFDRINLSINALLSYTEKILQQKETLANTDLLTGLPNRSAVGEMATKEIMRDDRYGEGCAVIFCDIDHFKQVNDRYGHDVGDDVLKRFGALLLESVRGTDTPGRWGGEEFLIIVPSKSVEEMRRFAEKLRQRVAEMQAPPIKQVTASFGVALRQGKEPFDSLCQRADEALYEAKTSGRNRVCVAKTDPADLKMPAEANDDSSQVA
ncbi:diguanylate cyclase [Magnetofaba australis]|nr:diguanylate cyclase [Magnetofaba australis]